MEINMINMLPVGIYQTDSSGKILFANSKLAEILEVDDPKYLLNKKMSDFTIEPILREEILEISANDAKISYLVKSAKGCVFKVSDHFQKLTNGDGITYQGTISKLPADFTYDTLKNANYLSVNERYQAIINNPNLSIILFDFDGIILESNQSTSNLLGYESEEMQNLNILDLVIPDNLDNILKMINDLKNQLNHANTDEFKLKRKDSSFIWVETISTVIHRNDKPFAVQCLIKEITDRKNAEISILERESQYRELIDLIPDPMIIYRNNKIIYANQACYTATGFSYGELIGQNIIKYIDDDYKAIVSENLIKRSKGIDVSDYEIKLNISSNKYLWVKVRAIITQYLGENAFIVVLNDVTEIREKEIEILEKQKLLESSNHDMSKMLTAIEQSVSSVIITDPDSIIEYTNPITESLTGYNVDELKGKNISIIFSGASDLELFDNISKIIKSGKVWKGEFENQNKNGNKFWLYSTVTPVFNSIGLITNFILIAEDISKRKIIERMIVESEAKNQALLNAIPDLMLIFDKLGNIVDSYLPNSSEFTFINSNVSGKKITECCSAEFSEFIFVYTKQFDNISSEHTLQFEFNDTDVQNYYEIRMVRFNDDKILLIARNTTQSKLNEINLRKQDVIKGILTKWASEFVNVMSESVDDKINSAFEDIGSSLNVDRVYLFTYDFKKGIASNTHEWCNSGISPEIDNLQEVPISEMLEWPKRHLLGEFIYIENILDLEKDNSVRLWLEPQGIKTLLTIPIIKNMNCIGFVGFDSCRDFKKWSDEETLVLKFLAELLGNLFDRIEKLKDKEIAEKALVKQTKIKEMLSNWSSELVNLPLDQIDQKVQKIISMVGNTIDVDRVYIFKYNFDQLTAYNTHEWCRDGIETAIDKFPEVPFEMMLGWVNYHKIGKPVFFSNLNELSEDDPLREILALQNTSAAASIPIYGDGECLGFVGLDLVNRSRKFDSDELMILTYLANLLYNLSDRVRIQKELIKQKNKAEESDKLKTAFLANMSHEIRTPLNGIIGFSKLLMSNELDEKDKLDYSTIIRQSSYRLIELINNILDISKIESGQMELVNSVVDVNKLMVEVYSLFEYEAIKKNIVYNLKIDNKSENLTIVTDYSKLYQILSKLLDNAIKFTNTGSVKFELEIKLNYLSFVVTDTGVGISEEYLPYLFERFSQENLELSKAHEGSGLGLAIAKGNSDLIGATIKVSSLKNQGSSFVVTLPINNANFKNITKMNQEQIMQLDWQESVVLIAEDDEVNFKYIEKLLSRVKGITTVRAKNGREAIELALKNQEINLVLMDVKMPVLDGYSATKQIKLQRPELPIIAVTAFAMMHDKQNSIDAGCDDYISKPFEADDILFIINKFLAKK